MASKYENKNMIMKSVFNQYDKENTGELSPIKVQILYGDIRIGGLSFQQVCAAIKYVCATENCHVTELFDLLQELDRRYYLVQDFRWEFSFLDREQRDTISVSQAKWFVQTVHGQLFSQKKWTNFLKARPVSNSGVSFAELEVMLCEIPSKTSLDQEEKEHLQLLQAKEKKKAELEAMMRSERERRDKMKHDQKRKDELMRENADDERRKKERDEEERRKALEEQEEMERLKRIEEEEKRRQKIEEDMYADAEKHKEDAEKAEKNADSELERIRREKAGADERKLKELEEEETKQKKLKTESGHRKLRYQLKVAIKSKDKYQLEYSIGQFKTANLSDDDMDLEKATKLLKQISAKEGLNKAMSKREIADLEKAMAFVRKHGFETQLAGEMMQANGLLARLRHLERIRHEILELKQATVAEIRSYQSPPTVVHTVMTATFMLLGHKENETANWKAVQALVGRTGKESLKRRCLELDASKLSLKLANRVKQLLSSYELDDVRDISAGAATFFVWATTMIEEAISIQKEKEN